MQINLVSLLYISFRLAPFILVSYLCLFSLFSQDFKALIYIAGLLIACFITILLNNNISDVKLQWLIYGDNEQNIPEVCQSLSLTGNYPLSRLPLSQTVFNFTFAYLLYVINKFSMYQTNLPTLIVFPLLIISDFMWNISYSCSTVIGLSISIGIGLLVGYLWAWMVDKLQVKNLQYFNGISGQSLCSRPSSQLFKCTVKSTGSSNTSDDDAHKRLMTIENQISQQLGVSVSAFTNQYDNSYQEGFTEKKFIQLPKSGIFIITADSMENKDANAIYTTMISGTRDSSISGGGHANDILLYGGSYKTLDDGTSITNGSFSMTALDDSYKTISIFSYEIYPKNSTQLTTKTAVNINTKTGGSIKEFTLPNKGIYYITIDGNELKDTSAIYGFYAVVNNGTYISTLNQLGFKYMTVDGTKSGFEASIADRTKYTNYHVYYNPLFDETTATVLRPVINLNQNANGSEQTITLPASGTYIITITNNNNTQSTNDIYSFYITGCLESNHASMIKTITASSVIEPKCGYTSTGLGNGQFSVVYNLAKDKKTNVFKIYYFKIYP